MKVLFDEDVPHKLARLLPQHEIHTVVSMQWGGITNGVAMRRAYCTEVPDANGGILILFRGSPNTSTTTA